MHRLGVVENRWWRKISGLKRV